MDEDHRDYDDVPTDAGLPLGKDHQKWLDEIGVPYFLTGKRSKHEILSQVSGVVEHLGSQVGARFSDLTKELQSTKETIERVASKSKRTRRTLVAVILLGISATLLMLLYLGKLRSGVDSIAGDMAWRPWTPMTTWDPDVRISGRWRRLGKEVEIVGEIIPQSSISSLGRSHRLVVSVPTGISPDVSAKVEETSMCVGTVVYRGGVNATGPLVLRAGELVYSDDPNWHSNAWYATDFVLIPEISITSARPTLMKTPVEFGTLSPGDFQPKSDLAAFEFGNSWLEFHAFIPIK